MSHIMNLYFTRVATFAGRRLQVPILPLNYLLNYVMNLALMP